MPKGLIDLDKRNFLQRHLNLTKNTQLFDLSLLARNYLLMKHKINSSTQKNLIQKETEITIQQEAERSENPKNLYLYETVIASTSEEIIAKKLLSKVYPKTRKLNRLFSELDSSDDSNSKKELNHSIKKNIDETNDLINRAENIISTYYEIPRARAILNLTEGNYSAANEEFLKAIALNDNYAPLLTHYGVFLMKHFGETENAITYLTKAYELDAHPETALRLGNAYKYLSNWNKASEYITPPFGKI